MFDSPFGQRVVSTTRIATSRPLTFRGFAPIFEVITSSYIVEKKKRSREKKRGFWRRLWDGLTDLNPWPYCRIEYYEIEVPSIVVDRRNNRIICHPSLEREIKKAVDERAIR